jgi:NAD(P)-dependent dehydrogenase (short-subunit alcohol dehydrogenase family)
VTALAGQTALVTGASSGIGRAIALELACRNVKLCLVGRRKQKLREVRKCAQESSETVIDFSVDLTEGRSAQRLANLVDEQLGELNILVHSAGVISLGTIERASIETFKRQIAANLIGPYLLTKKLLPFLKRSKGQVVFINSSIVCNPRPGTIQFAATQHALKGLADCLREELNAIGIRVVSVFPGRTATPRQERLYRAEGRPYTPERLLQAGDVAALVVDVLSLPASAEATDIHVRPTLKS